MLQKIQFHKSSLLPRALLNAKLARIGSLESGGNYKKDGWKKRLLASLFFL